MQPRQTQARRILDPFNCATHPLAAPSVQARTTSTRRIARATHDAAGARRRSPAAAEAACAQSQQSAGGGGLDRRASRQQQQHENGVCVWSRVGASLASETAQKPRCRRVCAGAAASIARVHRCISGATRTKLSRAALRSSLTPPQVEAAEAAVLAALQSAKGRGKDGMSPKQLASLNAALEVLEADGGVQGVRRACCACAAL